MKISKQRVTCKCGEVFDAEIVVECPIAVALASMGAVTCPKCGSGELGIMGGAYKDAPLLDKSTVEQRASWWIERGETGTSSLTIWVAFTGGVSPHRDHCYPLDPDDFRRCELLLDLIPEWRPVFSMTVTKRFPWMKPFTDRWEHFKEMYAKEEKTGRCQQLYKEMQTAAREADVMRYRKAQTR